MKQTSGSHPLRFKPPVLTLAFCEVPNADTRSVGSWNAALTRAALALQAIDLKRPRAFPVVHPAAFFDRVSADSWNLLLPVITPVDIWFHKPFTGICATM